MSKKLYVGSLSYDINNNDLEQIFAAVGQVESAKVISDSYTGRSKGFGFVEMSTEDEAKKAISELNGTVQQGRAIVVSEARPETKRTGGGGRGGRDGGGHGRGPGGGGRGEGRGGFGGGGGNRGRDDWR
jgi:cold-inducible RNA-binding protein